MTHATGCCLLCDVNGAAEDGGALRILLRLHECHFTRATEVNFSPFFEGRAVEALPVLRRAGGHVGATTAHREDVVASEALKQGRARETVVHGDVHARAFQFIAQLRACSQQRPKNLPRGASERAVEPPAQF